MKKEWTFVLIGVLSLTVYFSLKKFETPFASYSSFFLGMGAGFALLGAYQLISNKKS